MKYLFVQYKFVDSQKTITKCGKKVLQDISYAIRGFSLENKKH